MTKRRSKAWDPIEGLPGDSMELVEVDGDSDSDDSDDYSDEDEEEMEHTFDHHHDIVVDIENGDMPMDGSEGDWGTDSDEEDDDGGRR